VAWDRSGIGGVRLAGARPDDCGLFYLLSSVVRDRYLEPALTYMLECLDAAAAFGPAAVRWDLYGVRNADVTTVRNGNVVAAQGTVPAHYNNAVTIDDQLGVGAETAHEAAARLWQQLERLAGAHSY
jgi:hypothetical protein